MQENMRLKLEISVWTAHLNHLIYSYFYYCKMEKLKIDICLNTNVVHNGGVLIYDNSSIFFDYSDDTIFIDNPLNYDYYFKRSLVVSKKEANIFPLNFNVPLSYKCHSLLINLNIETLLFKPNREQIIKAIDKWAFFVKSSHGVTDIRNYPKKNKDNGGKIIFQTRLWNPDNHPDKEEKERRKLQNEFRINACRIIKNNFKNSSVGLITDNLSKNIAPDLILNSSETKKGNYFKLLNNFDIGIADDGLKDTPGWKIGEYLLFGKAVISTPLSVEIDGFEEHINYEKLSSRNSYEELPEKINILLKDKRYLELGENNLNWSLEYLHPKNYINRILNLIENKQLIH